MEIRSISLKIFLCFMLPLIWSASSSAAYYELNDHSTFSSDSGEIALTGSFTADFSLGVPPTSLDGRFDYKLDNFDLIAGGQSYRMEEFNLDFMPFLTRSSNVEVDRSYLGFGGHLKPLLSRINLQVDQIDSGIDFYVYRMLSLIPIRHEDDGFSKVDVGEDGIPTFFQLGYGLHEIIMRVEEAPSLSLSGPPSPAYHFITQSDTRLGFLHINASPVPVPAAAWLFGSALIGLGCVRRRISLS